jgi:putative ABC transport system permease protein
MISFTLAQQKVIEISWLHLGFAVFFVVFAGAVAAVFRLGLIKGLLIGMARCYVQLLLLGFALVSVFAWDYFILNVAILVTMAFFATVVSTNRVRKIKISPISLERLFTDFKSRRAEIRIMVSLGATPWEAALPSIRAAISAGLIPMMNSMAAAGIVFIPGMMTGQILANADTCMAAKYQIVIMFMLAASATLCTIIAVLWTYRRAFDEAGAPRPGVI